MKSVIYLCINLAWAEERRCSIAEQAEQLGIDIQLVEAVAGKDLTPEQRACYDSSLTKRYYNYHLTDNEIACTLSHRKALETFLASDAQYAVVLEDDAILSPHFREGIHKLTHHLHGWEVAKLNLPSRSTRHTRPISLPSGVGCSPHIEPVFSTRIGSEAVGFVYTRHAAQVLSEGLRRFYLPADSMIGQLILDKQIPTIALRPELVSQVHSGFLSTIESNDSAVRGAESRRNLLQYLRHRLRAWRNNLLRRKLYRVVQRTLYREG